MIIVGGTPSANKILVQFGRGLMHYKCRQKACAAPFSAGFGSSSQCMQRIVDCYPYWVYSQINKPLLYSILGYCGTLWYDNSFVFPGRSHPYLPKPISLNCFCIASKGEKFCWFEPVLNFLPWPLEYWDLRHALSYHTNTEEILQTVGQITAFL